MGWFKRGRGDEEQLELTMPSFRGLPPWADVTGLARQAASSAIRRKGPGAPDYMQVMSRMRTGWESARRTKGYRGHRPEDVMQILASETVGVSRGGKAPSTAPRGDAYQEMFSAWRPAEAARVRARQEAGVGVRRRGPMPEGPAKYRRFLSLYQPLINAAAAEAGINVRQANSIAWAAYKSTQPTAGAVPSVLRAAILSGHPESAMPKRKSSKSGAPPKPSKSVFKKGFAKTATAAEKAAIKRYLAWARAKKAGKPAASKKRASSGKARSSAGSATNLCTPGGHVRKPSSEVFAAVRAKRASSAQKRHWAVYLAWKRAGSPGGMTKAAAMELVKKASSKKAAASKKASSKKAAASKKGASGKPAASVFKRNFAGKATAAEKAAIQRYLAARRAAKGGKKRASSKKRTSARKPASGKKRSSRKRASSKKPPVMAIRPAKSAATAAKAVVNAVKAGKTPASGKVQPFTRWLPAHKDEVRAAIGSRKMNYLVAARLAHAAYDRAPQGQKAEAIKLAIREASKAKIAPATSAGKPAKSRKTKPAKSRASARRGSQRFAVSGSVTVSAA